MSDNTSPEHHHGTFVVIDDHGVLITGPAGIGKSSLALELLHQGHQLIADDSIEFQQQNNHIIGSCPMLLEQHLHTRELGLINVIEQFGSAAWQAQHRLDIVVQLQHDIDAKQTDLKPELIPYQICDQTYYALRLSIQNPASLSHRLKTWVRCQKNADQNINAFKQRQQQAMDEAHNNKMKREHSWQ